MSSVYSLIQLTLECLYDKNKLLSIQDKKDCIETWYGILILYMVRFSQARIYNISCKSGVNRGGKSNSILFKLLCILMDKENTASYARIHRVITHAPALLAEQQTIALNRRERLFSALALLQNEAVQKRLKSLAPILGIVSKSTIKV